MHSGPVADPDILAYEKSNWSTLSKEQKIFLLWDHPGLLNATDESDASLLMRILIEHPNEIFGPIAFNQLQTLLDDPNSHLDHYDHSGNTLLHYALYNNHPSIALKILKAAEKKNN